VLSRPFYFLTIALLTCNCVAARAESPAASAEQERFFEEQVRPALAERCFKCHGEKKQESGLRLDSRAALLAGGDSGETVATVGQPERSLLITAIRYQGDFHMPPDKKLADTEIAALVEWVKIGLPWPNADSGSAPQLSAAERIELARKSHWAFQPIRRAALPDVKDVDWAATPLDRFVLAKLEAAGLTPSPSADRHTLIRRATFDLLGLPPTPDEVEAFVNDASPDAYQRLIDRLLASPRYGERWGRHWLDVARYADTRGYSFGKERRFPYAYTYRDYVIGAFNEDVPYDRFVVEQLAADKLSLPENDASLAAMGYLTVGRKFNNQHDDIDDQIDVVCRGLLGLTVACARCHDHKYDAIPTEDYYSLYGVFASSRQPDDLPLIGKPQDNSAYEAFQKELDKRQKALDDFVAGKHAELLDTSRKRVTDYLVRVISNQPETLLQKLPFISLNAEDLKPKLVERWRAYLRQHAKPDHPVWGPWSELAALPESTFADKSPPIVAKWTDAPAGTSPGQLNPLVKTALSQQTLTSTIDVARLYGKLLEDSYSAWQQAGRNSDALAKLSDPQRQIAQLLFDDGTPIDIPSSDILGYLVRADRNKHGELTKEIDSFQVSSPGAPPRAMVVVDTDRPHDPRVFIRGNFARPGPQVPRQFVGVIAGNERQPFHDGSGRLELARAIVAADNPLTARVIANRVWMQHFGEPLVTTPSDFGIRSDPPSHPELLDYLALSLQQDDWSLKSLHRAILLSSTYQQASVDRPACREVDPENRLLWRMNRRRLEFEPLRDSLLLVAGQLDTTSGGRPVDLMTTPFTRRRAVYGLIDRQDLPNLLRAFDFASPDQSSERRPRTTVPQQALFMMNSPLVIEQAKALVARTELAATTDPAERIATLYRILFAREPMPGESQVGQRYLAAASTDTATSAKLSAWEQYAQLLLLTNEFMYID
jgi:hypothetical protein